MNPIFLIIFALIFIGYGMLLQWAISQIRKEKRVEKFILKNLSKKSRKIYEKDFKKYDITRFPQIQIFLWENLGEEKFNILKAMLNIDLKIEKVKRTKDSTIYRINNELVEIFDGYDFELKIK